MNKFFLGLIAIGLSIAACQNGKNSAKSDTPTQKGDMVVSSEDNFYHNNEKTNELLFKNRWVLVAYIDPEGQETSYSGLKIYSFKEKTLSFNDDFPNDCNNCSVKADYDLKQQLINVDKRSPRPCTELKCRASAATLADNTQDGAAGEFRLVLEENMSYKILKNNTLELSTSMGRYLFRIYTDLREQKFSNLDNSSWEIIAYSELKNQPSEKFQPLKKGVLISFNSEGYGYSPDCNSCSYTLKNFSSKDGIISWDKKVDVIHNGMCTQMACLDQKIELPHSIVSNGMTYTIAEDYLYLSDDKYKLKLRPYKVK